MVSICWTGTAVLLLLLLAWSSTFLPNLRGIRSCYVDVMTLLAVGASRLSFNSFV